MEPNRFDIRWLGHFEPDNKIWGWYLDKSMVYDERKHKIAFCFWAVCGKTISIKKHVYRYGEMELLAKKKIGNGYKQITTEELCGMWPGFYDDLHRKVIFETLSFDSWEK